MAASDLSPAEFRNALVDNGFAYLGRSVDRYVDIYNRRLGLIEPVKSGKTTLRQQTLARLLGKRAALRETDKAEAARQARLAATAAAIAPQALPPVRADLVDGAAIAQLADDFVLGTTAAEGISFNALIAKGWSAAQLKAYAEPARALADRRQIAEVAHV